MVRKPRVRRVVDSDMRWLWAAYRKGMWPELFHKGLTQNAFVEKMTEVIGSVQYEWIIDAKGVDGTRPVGLILADSRAAGRAIEPHVDWFPWATSRNCMEGSAAFLKHIGKRHKIFIYSDEPSIPFWERMIRYGILRRGCKIVDYFAMGEHTVFFYTAGPQ